MSERDRDILAARLLDGEPITQSEARKLASAVKEDPAFGRELRSQLRLSELLSQKFNPTRSDEAFIASMWGRFKADRTGTRFVERTVERIRASERPRARKTIWWLLPAAACLAVIVGSFLYNNRQADRLPEQIAARILVTAPGVEVLRGENTIIAVIGMDILPGDRIETGRGERVRLGYSHADTWVMLDEVTEVSFPDAARGAGLVIEKGTIDANVAKRSADVPFVIVTAEARCEVKGTRFLLASARGATRVEVAAGTVGITQLNDGQSIDVGAGQLALAREEGGELSARPNDNPSKGVLPAVALSDDGEEILHDDFQEGLDRWEVVIEDSPDTWRVLTDAESDLYEWDGEAGTARRGKVTLFVEKLDDDKKRLGLRMKEQLPDGPIVIEQVVDSKTGGYINFLFGGGTCIDEVDYFGGRKFNANAILLRRELIPMESARKASLYDYRSWYNPSAAGRMPFQLVSVETLKMQDRRLIITGRKKDLEIMDVVIRRIATPGAR